MSNTKKVSGFFTKPLQGAWFKYFKKVIMGYVPVEPVTIEDSKMKERDEEHKKGHDSLILRVLKSNQVSSKHGKDHVGKSNVTWADVVSSRKQGPSEQNLQYTKL